MVLHAVVAVGPLLLRLVCPLPEVLTRGQALTYWQRARGPAPPVAAPRLTSLLHCQGIQAPSERPHVLAWYLLFSEGMYAQVVEEPLACAPSWTV